MLVLRYMNSPSVKNHRMVDQIVASATRQLDPIQSRHENLMFMTHEQINFVNIIDEPLGLSPHCGDNWFQNAHCKTKIIEQNITQ